MPSRFTVCPIDDLFSIISFILIVGTFLLIGDPYFSVLHPTKIINTIKLVKKHRNFLFMILPFLKNFHYFI
ncbi:hypothetical protein THER_1508 [Thermodesulfovibrio sp. N1]|nr:hypothetical protein THER_1508 [Thermodesulfovibrio sp. N1]